jgi:spore coat protein H
MPLTRDQYDKVASRLSDEVKSNYENYKRSYEKPMPFYMGSPTLEGDMISLMWEVAYSFDAESVTYTFELAKDYSFTSPIVKETDLSLPCVKFNPLPAGQYFMRVTAYDEVGDTLVAFDYYITEKGKVYGTKCIYVDADVRIAEDVYVEE